MPRRRSISYAAFAALYLAIALPAAAQTSADSLAIVQQSRAFSAAYERGDLDGMMAIYTDDAVIFPGNVEMIIGSDDLRSYWALGPAQRITHHQATPTGIRIEGDMASDYGVYEISGIRGGEAWGPFLGKYLIVWERGDDGAWRMHLDMWNPRPRDVQPAPDCLEMAATGTVHGGCIEEVDLAAHFEGMDATFVLYDMQTGRARVHNRSRARERFRPASTFKIPNSIIALEEGTAEGPEFTIPWDSTAAPPQDWWPRSWRGEQTLRSALSNSVYWYYQELARRTDEQAMQRWLDRFDYGNRDRGDNPHSFWLRGPLEITPFEQITFLARLHRGRLGISDRTTDLIKEMLVLEEGDGYILSGKTGTWEVTSTREQGWLVGYVETDTGVHLYALNIEGESVWDDWPPQKRKELVKTLLADLEVL